MHVLSMCLGLYDYYTILTAAMQVKKQRLRIMQRRCTMEVILYAKEAYSLTPIYLKPESFSRKADRDIRSDVYYYKCCAVISLIRCSHKNLV